MSDDDDHDDDHDDHDDHDDDDNTSGRDGAGDGNSRSVRPGKASGATVPVISAAEGVLRTAGAPLHYREITSRILASGQSRLRSKTPENTVTAILSVDIQENPNSKFQRVDRGTYGLREWQDKPPTDSPPPAAPTPDPASQLVDECVKRYRREIFAFQRLAEAVEESCWKLLDQTGVQAQVQSRAKAPGSFAKKVRRYLSQPNEAEKLLTCDDVFARIGDLAGVRVLTYVEADRPRLVSLIQDAFADVVVEEKNRLSEGKFYRATHCQVALKADATAEADEPLVGIPCEIQVCSMLAHVWNEIEHDLDYKPEDSLTDGERALLQALGYQTLAGDTVISQLLQTIAYRRASK